jgi:hypothetical protein
MDAIKTDAQLTAEEEAEEYGKDWQSVTIADQIEINFLLNVEAHAGMKGITISYTNQGLAYKDIKVDVNKLDVDEKTGYYRVPAVVAPAQTGDTITVTILEEDGTTTTTYYTSVADYCYYLLDGNFSAKVKDLAAATLEYGQAAKTYFDYEPDAPAFADTQDAKATLDAGKLNAENYTPVLTVNAGGKITGVSLMVLTKPEFRFYTTGLTETQALALNKKITVDGPASAQFVKIADTEEILLEVTDIEAANMDKVITITIDGFGTITFRGNDFAWILAQSSDSATAVLGAALYNYGLKAKDCFNA